jgi:integrase
MLLLLTGARIGETLALRWEAVSDDGVLTFVHTTSGKIRCVGGTEEVKAVLDALPRVHPLCSRVRAQGSRTPLMVCERCCDARLIGRISIPVG